MNCLVWKLFFTVDQRKGLSLWIYKTSRIALRLARLFCTPPRRAVRVGKGFGGYAFDLYKEGGEEIQGGDEVGQTCTEQPFSLQW